MYATGYLQKYIRLQCATVTRWNFEVKMIQSVLDVPQNDPGDLDITHKLSQHEGNLLTDLCNIVESFFSATDFMHEDQIITSSFVILNLVCGLKVQL